MHWNMLHVVSVIDFFEEYQSELWPFALNDMSQLIAKEVVLF